jgi:rhodanese-related sulfurtransferase
LSLGLAVVDARDRWTFAEAHIPGSLNIEPFDSFASNVGSTVPFGTAIALVIDERDQALLPDLVNAAYRIGYRVEAVLEPGIDAWREQGFLVDSYPATDVLELIEESAAGSAPAILDVRDPHEWAEGIIPGSTTMTLHTLGHRAHELRDELMPRADSGRLTVVCHGGARAAVAASYLSRLGIPVRAVLGGGIPDALAALQADA